MLSYQSVLILGKLKEGWIRSVVRMDVIENFDHYIVELDDLLFDLYSFIQDDQFIMVSKKFSELRALFTEMEHDYLTKIKDAVSVKHD